MAGCFLIVAITFMLLFWVVLMIVNAITSTLDHGARKMQEHETKITNGMAAWLERLWDEA